MAHNHPDVAAAKIPRAPPNATAFHPCDLTSVVLPVFYTINLCTCCIAALIWKAIVHLQHSLIFNLKQRHNDGDDTMIEGSEQ